MELGSVSVGGAHIADAHGGDTRDQSVEVAMPRSALCAPANEMRKLFTLDFAYFIYIAVIAVVCLSRNIFQSVVCACRACWVCARDHANAT